MYLITSTFVYYLLRDFLAISFKNNTIQPHRHMNATDGTEPACDMLYSRYSLKNSPFLVEIDFLHSIILDVLRN